MVGIVEPGFLSGFTWSQSGVFIEAGDKCTGTADCIVGVITQCYYKATMAPRRKSALWLKVADVLYYTTLHCNVLHFFYFIRVKAQTFLKIPKSAS